MGIGAAHDQDAGRQAGLVGDRDARDERAHAEADQGDALRIDIGLGLRPIDHAPDVDHGADEPADHLIEQLEELSLGAGVANGVPIEQRPLAINLEDVDRSRHRVFSGRRRWRWKGKCQCPRSAAR